MAAFLSLLRDNGFLVGLEEASDCLRFAAMADLARPSVLRTGLRSICSTRMADWQRFDELFDDYWLKRGIKGLLRVSGVPPKDKGARRVAEGGAPGGAGGRRARVSRAGEDGIGNPAE